MKKILLLIYIIFCAFSTFAQVRGKITNSRGEILAFANIYLEGTSQGTTSNSEGTYTFELSPGQYRIVYQYIGYQQKIVAVNLGLEAQEIDVILLEETVELPGAVIDAYAEDPAYAIIRKAIAKRKYYKNLAKEYSCDVYIKGIQKVLKAPEQILGQDIGDMDGSLDSNRQGIVYLSESLAKLYVRRPNKVKEHMISSKLSGDDNGFSFNQASTMDFNFYDNHIEIERALLSPIANTALQYYDYELLGTFFDEQKHLINKIEVIPKRAEDPVFQGIIYIVEDLWNIQSVDLALTGAAIKQPVLDTLRIRQIHVPIQHPDLWMQLSQTLDFSFGLLGIEVEGRYTGVFSNYNISPKLPEKFFTNEIFRVELGANEKEEVYWDSIRPIPLTIDEARDYVRKDSIYKVRHSKEYLDSIDLVNNKLETLDLLTEYTWKNSYKRISFSYQSPITSLQFNPVQGFNGNLDFRFTKSFDRDWTKWYRINPKLQYGFNDEKLRGELNFIFNFNKTKFTRIEISGGSMTGQFNNTEPLSPFLNSVYSLFDKKNYMKTYKKEFWKVKGRHEIVNGLLLKGSVEYAHRSPLTNTASYSFFKKHLAYDYNYPIIKDKPIEILPHSAFIVEASFRIRFNQKYLSYPNRKYIEGSKFPDFLITYRKGIPILGSEVSFDQLRLNISGDFKMGLLGYSEFNLETGAFISSTNLEYLDYQHFSGNQTIFGKPSRYLSSFMRLPYYDYSTKDPYGQFHYEHHFEGYLLDKIPLIRALGWKTIIGASLLLTKENNPYYEVGMGFENIGISALRFLRLDIISSFSGGKYLNTGIRFGFDF